MKLLKYKDDVPGLLSQVDQDPFSEAALEKAF